MNKHKKKRFMRRRAHLRSRQKLAGTAARPRLAMHRTLNHMYAQVIDDEAGRTLCSASTRSSDLKDLGTTGNSGAAAKVGELIAARAKAAGISKVVCDRGGSRYHGRVKAAAEAARKGGLDF
jgi:large subunit ribosomal protein L18